MGLKDQKPLKSVNEKFDDIDSVNLLIKYLCINFYRMSNRQEISLYSPSLKIKKYKIHALFIDKRLLRIKTCF
jgi:hypothetical protein